MELTDAASRLIVALDFGAAEPALAMVETLGERLRWVKVGLELYLAAGPTIVTRLRARGLRVFLDLKLHDIPNTVGGATRAVAASGAELLTVHTLGGPAMLDAAQRAASAGIDVLGVTVLTSMDDAEMRAAGLSEGSDRTVLRLAGLAFGAGLRGVVCSPLEVEALRRTFGPEPLLVVPGIRPHNAFSGDQSRCATPREALQKGASLLVVGRPITQANDPLGAFNAIIKEMEGTLQGDLT